MTAKILTPDNVKMALYGSGALIVALIIYKAVQGSKSVTNAVKETFDDVADTVGKVSETMGGFFRETITPSNMTTAIVKATMPSTSPGNVREAALAELNARRIAADIENLSPFKIIPSLFSDAKNWYEADTYGKGIRDNFYARNPDGVFYD